MSAVLAAVALLCAQQPQLSADLPETPISLSQDNFEAWTRHIDPAPEEQRWRQIPWKPSLAEGLEQAGAETKPLLLWAMNGHPLGCT